MSETPPLIAEKGRPGRRQTLVAKAWLTRKKRHAIFQSHISLGDGRVRTRSTGTHRRELALDFCALHLAEVMSARPSSASPASDPLRQAQLL